MTDDRSDLTVQRQVDLDLLPEELWELVADGRRWKDWLAADAQVVVTPGERGTVLDDDGVSRLVRVDEVGRDRVRFVWWPENRVELASTVELVVMARIGGSRLRITETMSAGAVAATGAHMEWEVRAAMLWCRALATVYV
jgi:hypothetical protein